jgi:hypothetical protein
MTTRNTWDIHYNIKWFCLYNMEVCIILSVFVWMYPGVVAIGTETCT